MTTNEPKVTGLSPMTGPPGTKITVRGDNLGQSSNDIIALTINGADCLPYLEWKSTKKIITRCTKVLGNGDVIITTKSGGLGSCDVQFNCYEQRVGLTDSSAVWVEEDYPTPEKEKLAVQRPNKDFSFELTSSKFNPQLFLVQNYPSATLSDLEEIYKTMQEKLNHKLNPETVDNSSNHLLLLKSNLPVIMECLHVVERLCKVIITSRDPSIDEIVVSIENSLDKTHELFDPLLTQKDLVQSLESAMQVFKHNEALFDLPPAIDNSIKTRNYDSVIQEILGVMNRLKTVNIEPSLKEKIELDVKSNVDRLRETIKNQLLSSCECTNHERNIDEMKKLMNHMSKLGTSSEFDIWIALKRMTTSLKETLTKLYETHSNTSLLGSKNERPGVVDFVQSAINVFQYTYYDILALGRAYFDPTDEFACSESNDLEHTRKSEFYDQMTTDPIHNLCGLLRSALISDNESLPWPPMVKDNEKNAYVSWLRHVLQCVINCYIQLNKMSSPLITRASLEEFKELVLKLRYNSLQVIFDNAARINRGLHSQEDWISEVDDLYGSITSLPTTFEKNIVETIKFANEPIFKPSLPDEKPILKQFHLHFRIKGFAQNSVNSFIHALNNALLDGNDANRQLISICNSQYTKEQVLPKLQDEFSKLQGLEMDEVFKLCNDKYSEFIRTKSNEFCRIKSEELASNANESQINLLNLHAQIFLIAPQLVNHLMTSIVNETQKILKSDYKSNL